MFNQSNTKTIGTALQEIAGSCEKGALLAREALRSHAVGHLDQIRLDSLCNQIVTITASIEGAVLTLVVGKGVAHGNH